MQDSGRRALPAFSDASSTPDSRARAGPPANTVPRVIDPPLVLDGGHLVADDAVAAREDRAVGADLVEARPDRRRRRVLHHDTVEPARQRVVRAPLDADPGQLHVAQPRDAGSTAAATSPGIRERHQKAQDADRLAAAQRRVLVRACPGRRQHDLVVLGTPSRRSRSRGLCLEDERYARRTASEARARRGASTKPNGAVPAAESRSTPSRAPSRRR